jgi:hypothetical protein
LVDSAGGCNYPNDTYHQYEDCRANDATTIHRFGTAV